MGSAGIMDLRPADDKASVLPILEITWIIRGTKILTCLKIVVLSILLNVSLDRKNDREKPVSTSAGISLIMLFKAYCAFSSVNASCLGSAPYCVNCQIFVADHWF